MITIRQKGHKLRQAATILSYIATSDRPKSEARIVIVALALPEALQWYSFCASDILTYSGLLRLIAKQRSTWHIHRDHNVLLGKNPIKPVSVMTVSLDYDPDSGPQGGISRLRRLASFGRYGADVHASARTACSQVLDDRRQDSVKECSLLAASLSSFYGWVAKQIGSKVVLGEKSSRRTQKLHVTQQVGDLLGSYDASPLHP